MGFWTDKRVLVTGGGGFIGSHLCEALVRDGAAVRPLVHYNALGSRGWLDHSALRNSMEITMGDVCERDSVKSAMEGCEVVFHLAALIGIPYSYKSPSSYVRTNVEGTLNVLQSARELGVSRVVHTSTSEVYGSPRSVPISESHALQGQSPYSASKIGADKLVESYHLSFAVPVVTVRPFNTFGPRQSARAVIPTIITQGLCGESLKLGGLDPTRDFNFVSNTVDGFLLAGESKKAVGQTINLGTGREISIGALVKLISGQMGHEITVELDPSRIRPAASEVERLLADNTAAKELLGWTPRVCLEDGLKLTIEWIRENLDRFRVGTYTV